jgi:hypothetical protein
MKGCRSKAFSTGLSVSRQIRKSFSEISSLFFHIQTPVEVRQGRVIKASVNLQGLRRKIYSKAKTDSVGSSGVGGRFQIRYLYPKAAPSR